MRRCPPTCTTLTSNGGFGEAEDNSNYGERITTSRCSRLFWLVSHLTSERERSEPIALNYVADSASMLDVPIVEY